MKSKKPEKTKLVIGRKDKVDFPKLHLYDIDTKIDTGAFTSAIDCRDIKVVTRNNIEKVSFKLHNTKHPYYFNKRFIYPIHTRKRIKSSFGHSEERYIIKTKIKLFEKLYDIELSLSNRDKMESPVLLGRKILKNNFIVDVNKVNLSYRRKLKKHKEFNK